MDTTIAIVIIVALFAVIAIVAYIRFGGPGGRNTTDINVLDKLRYQSKSSNERPGSATIEDSIALTGDATARATGDAAVRRTGAGGGIQAEAGLSAERVSEGESRNPKGQSTKS